MCVFEQILKSAVKKIYLGTGEMQRFEKILGDRNDN